MPRRRSACQRCAAIKVSCNSEQPCSRCNRLSLLCSYTPVKSASISIVNESSPDGPRKRIKHKRSPNGCIGCLQRRRKCDEVHPTCGDCHRLGLECTPRAKVPRSTAVSQHSLEESQAPNYRQHVQIQHCHSATSSMSPEGTQPSELYMDWVALIEDNGDRKLISHTNLNESNALAKGRKFPSKSSLLTYVCLEGITGVTENMIKDWTATDFHLYNHFIQVVARALVVVDDDKNPFLLHIVPMGMKHKCIFHAYMALSTCHLKRVYEDFQEEALNQQTLALQFLKREIESEPDSEVVLTTTLMLCLYEVCEGNSRRWILHLHGAKALLKPLSPNLTPDTLLWFLFELFDFLCCIAAITTDMAPRAFRYTFSPDNKLYIQKIHPLYGTSQDLYIALNNINDLARRRKSRHDSIQADEHFQEQSAAIKLFLEEWLPPTHHSTQWDVVEASAAGTALKWAALLRLHQVVHGKDTSHPYIQEAIIEILRAIALIRPGSKAEARMLFPLFMAGSGSSTKSNRLTVEFRLSILENTVGMGSITAVHKVLDSVWQRTNDGENVDWEEFFKEEYSGIMLF